MNQPTTEAVAAKDELNEILLELAKYDDPIIAKSVSLWWCTLRHTQGMTVFAETPLEAAKECLARVRADMGVK